MSCDPGTEYHAVKAKVHSGLVSSKLLTTSEVSELDSAAATGGIGAWLQKLLQFAKTNPQLLAWIMSLFGGNLPFPVPPTPTT